MSLIPPHSSDARRHANSHVFTPTQIVECLIHPMWNVAKRWTGLVVLPFHSEKRIVFFRQACFRSVLLVVFSLRSLSNCYLTTYVEVAKPGGSKNGLGCNSRRSSRLAGAPSSPSIIAFIRIRTNSSFLFPTFWIHYKHFTAFDYESLSFAGWDTVVGDEIVVFIPIVCSR